MRPLMAGIILSLLGCAAPDLLIQDRSGAPIEGAKVVGTSMSISGQTTYSDTRGHASIPSAIQATKWITVSKEGFRNVENIDVAKSKPIVVILDKE